MSPFRMVCRNFILPEPASYVFFCAVSNLRKLLYIISFASDLASTEFYTLRKEPSTGGFMYSAINAATPTKSGVGGVDNGITFNFGYIVSYNFNWHISLNICLSNIMGNKRLCWIAWIITYCSGTSNCFVAHYRNSFLPNSQEPQLYLFTFEF